MLTKSCFLDWRSHGEDNICTYSLTCLHKRTQPEGLSCICSVPGKRKVAVAGRLSAPDQYRSAFTCLCARLFSSVILSFAELCSFVVHLLWCVGSIYLKSSLSPPPAPPKPALQIAGSSCPQQFLLSHIIHQAHLQAGRTDLTKAWRIYIPALHVRLGMTHINTHPSVTILLQLLQATGGLPVSTSGP